MGSCVHGFMRSWVHGFMRSCVFGFMRFRVHAFSGSCVFGFRRFRVQAFSGSGVFGFMRFRVQAFSGSGVFGFRRFRVQAFSGSGVFGFRRFRVQAFSGSGVFGFRRFRVQAFSGSGVFGFRRFRVQAFSGSGVFGFRRFRVQAFLRSCVHAPMCTRLLLRIVPLYGAWLSLMSPSLARHFSILKRSKLTLRCSFISSLGNVRPRITRLFCLNGLPMTKGRFRVHLSTVVEGCGLPSPFYTGHSFRIEAATTAAEQGLPVAPIKRLGRRSSTAYESYIRSNSWFFLQGTRCSLTLVKAGLTRLLLQLFLAACFSLSVKVSFLFLLVLVTFILFPVISKFRLDTIEDISA
ncbi:unnamed protein product [Boreogadus saida]